MVTITRSCPNHLIIFMLGFITNICVIRTDRSLLLKINGYNNKNFVLTNKNVINPPKNCEYDGILTNVFCVCTKFRGGNASRIFVNVPKINFKNKILPIFCLFLSMSEISREELFWINT